MKTTPALCTLYAQPCVWRGQLKPCWNCRAEPDSKRQTDWDERDLAVFLTRLLAGLRADELRQAVIGDIRTTDDGAAVIDVKGKGGKERSVPIEAELLSVIQRYLESRRNPIPQRNKPQTGRLRVLATDQHNTARALADLLSQQCKLTIDAAQSVFLRYPGSNPPEVRRQTAGG
jgi:integrase